MVSMRPMQEGLTRALDILVAALSLIFFLPLFGLVAVLVKLTDGGSVFFVQERIGRGGAVFRCLKFRTMAQDAEARLKALLETDVQSRDEWTRTQKLRHDPRVTFIGRFLRNSSLDELPQLINILRGEMSLVGPRPIVAAEVKRYGRDFELYCAVKPGLTGLWQVSGRSEVAYEERVRLDATYVRSRNLALDLKILALTVPAVLFQRGSC